MLEPLVLHSLCQRLQVHLDLTQETQKLVSEELQSTSLHPTELLGIGALLMLAITLAVGQ